MKTNRDAKPELRRRRRRCHDLDAAAADLHTKLLTRGIDRDPEPFCELLVKGSGDDDIKQELDAPTCCDAVPRTRAASSSPTVGTATPTPLTPRDDHSNDGGDETDEDETDGDTSHEGRYD
ncbi:hypothetical protein U9M48_028802 [Paspalum notatum var. saurae]|uniref:Uncharacterized protein n=1 Tax=Paspalum notatum var. saurae TaxID=547442 RepID=A0AAQ3TXI1_PASNO